MDVGRYHLTLYTGSQPVMHGYWDRLATTEDKFRRWIGEHGSVDGARVELVDTADGRVLKSWPADEP